MKYYYLVVVSIIIIGCKQNKPVKEKAVAKVSTDTIFFKEKKKDDTTILRFSISNIGTSPLKIINSSASCGCTSIIFDTGYIQPLKHSNIQLVYTHTGIKMGDVLKNVILETNTNPQFNVIYLKEGQ